MPDTLIPYGKHCLDERDRRSVLSVLKSDRITQGPAIDRFEKEFAAFCGARYAVALSSGTAALHLSSLALGLGEGDEAITSPISFVATSNSILYARARPTFADIEGDTVNLSPAAVEKKINRSTKAIYPTHFAGLACRMPELEALAARRSLKIVEDGCHALGAKYLYKNNWVKVGSCRHSRMTVFSFHPVKHITTGEGGVITTNSRVLYRQLCALRTHGIYRSRASQRRHGPWHYEMRELGFNYRMTDIQAALGISQLARAEEFIEKRRRIADVYKEGLKNVEGLSLPAEPEGYYHTYHLFVIRVRGAKKEHRRRLMDYLQKNGIGSQVHYIPIYRQPYYRRLGYRDRCLEAERYFSEAVSLPIYPALSGAQQKKVIETLKRFV